MLRWKAKDLADNSGVSWATIQRMETEDGTPNTLAKNVILIKNTLENAGIEFFPDNGVKLK
ncbi:MAG: hypothetical protein K0R98_693 [Rickettsiaceae bacterium]|nr:hypothetical protein [Rickettsiaceae bacterium]